MTATILVVDDLEANIRLLEAKLLKEYYTVITATSGKQAIEILQKEKIDVILLDGMMPEMDGFQTCKKIKSDPETTHIPVVMVTALSEVEDRIKGLEAGADEFLTKPVDDMALMTRVRSLSRMKAMMDELKLRNQTNTDLGESIIEIDDNFTDTQILIIDDDVIQSKNVTKSLLKLTPNIRSITDLSELELISQNYIPDVVIISCQLENEDPLRVAVNLRVKELLRYTSFVLMTEEEDMSLVIKGMELGVNDYFHYPLDENELLARIKTQLRRKKYQDSLRDGLDKSVSLSIKDGLTGVYNRRYFDMHIEHVISKARSAATGVALLMFDIDHFKAVNDTYGHQAGDAIIKDFAEIIKKALRVTDLLARYGGEEFVAAIYDVTLNTCTDVAERIRESIEKHDFIAPNLEAPLKKTVSIGVSFYHDAISCEKFIEEADKALYEAKETGRNKVCLYKSD